MPLSPDQQDLVKRYLTDTDAISAVVLGLCWNESALAGAARIPLKEKETVEEAVKRHGLGWNPA